MGRPWSFLLVVPFILSTQMALAAPDSRFDQGVDSRSALEAARRTARNASLPATRGDSQDSGTPVWVSVANADVEALGDEFGFPARTPVARGDLVSVYQVKESELDLLAEVMNAKLHKSPGFFAHPSLAAAKSDLASPPAAMTRAYPIDQDAVVRALLKLVDEGRLVATIGKLASYKNRYYRSKTGVESAKWVAEHWGELSKGRADMSVALFKHGGFEQESVILTVRGTAEPDKVVVLGGHEDSIAGWFGGADSVAPGADDNASGVAVLTEAVRVIAASGYRPKQTLKFMAFAAEETGLRGSREIADNFKKEGIQVLGMANFDMANYKGSAEDIWMISDNTNAAQNAFLGKLVETYTDYRWSTTACGYGCSDHASWTTNGFAASFPFETKMGEDNPNIHSAKDTLAQTGGNALHAFKFAKLAVAYLVEMAK